MNNDKNHKRTRRKTDSRLIQSSVKVVSPPDVDLSKKINMTQASLDDPEGPETAEQIIMQRYDVNEAVDPEEKKILAKKIVDRAFDDLYAEFPLYKEANLHLKPIVKGRRINETDVLEELEFRSRDKWPKIKAKIHALQNVAQTFIEAEISVGSIRDARGKLVDPLVLIQEIAQDTEDMSFRKKLELFKLIYVHYGMLLKLSPESKSIPITELGKVRARTVKGNGTRDQS